MINLSGEFIDEHDEHNKERKPVRNILRLESNVNGCRLWEELVLTGTWITTVPTKMKWGRDLVQRDQIELR